MEYHQAEDLVEKVTEALSTLSGSVVLGAIIIAVAIWFG